MVSVVFAGALLAATALGQSAPRGIAGGSYVGPDGEITKGGLVIVEAGRIKQVGGDVPANVPIDRFPDAVLVPGFVDCYAGLGAIGNLSELQNPVQPRARTRDAFDAFSPQLRAALQAGVTTFALVPDDSNLVGGQIAVCQTSGPGGRPRVLTEQGPMKLSIAPAAFRPEREPTSRAGAIELLRRTLQTAARGKADDPLTQLATGKLPGLITTPSGADVLAALELADAAKLKWTLIHTIDAREIAGSLKGKGLGVIVGPLDLSAPLRLALAPGEFEKVGVKVAIAGGLPETSADSLRLGAAVAVRAGLSKNAARRAITGVPAELLGVADRVGVLKDGLQADVVVFSGDPLDLRSRVLAVYVAGERVFSAATAPREVAEP